MTCLHAKERQVSPALPEPAVAWDTRSLGTPGTSLADALRGEGDALTPSGVRGTHSFSVQTALDSGFKSAAPHFPILMMSAKTPFPAGGGTLHLRSLHNLV